MKYYEVKFSINGPETVVGDVRDVVSALAGEAGFETFEETAGGGLTGYVQQALFSRETLDALLDSCPFEGVSVSYDVEEAEERDWNAQWEQEGFQPISVGDSLTIHDGRHLPEQDNNGLSIEIDAQLAFGTGNHETTRMMCGTLLETDLKGKRVLDCGCGTGILGITALKLGAAECTAYDIDEWSVDNTRHNAIINHVDEDMTTLLGDASVIKDEWAGRFDVVMANINRNILLADMEAFVKAMKEGGMLLMSGFYREDVPLLTTKARELGLEPAGQKEENGWACIQMLRAPH